MLLVALCLQALCSCFVATTSTPNQYWQYSNDSLLWGPYRPNLYFGVRPRMREGLLAGLMWSNVDNAARISKNLRHTCEQDEGMAGYGWTAYDPRTGGHEIIHDTGNKIDLSLDYVKDHHSPDDDWGLRISGRLRDDAQRTQRTTAVFYIGHEALHGDFECGLSPSSDAEASCAGLLAASKRFTLDIIPAMNENDMDSSPVIMNMQSLQVPRDTLWQAKSIFLNQLNAEAPHQTILSSSPGRGNLHLIQLTFVGDFDFDVLFASGPRIDNYSSEALGSNIDYTAATFEDQFKRVYNPQSPFNATQDYTIFSQSLLANLMGGIGYFHGTSKVSMDPKAEKSSLTSADAAIEDRGPYELFSAVPSRPFFPRGFLWDEGFHLQAVLDWDIDLAMEMATSWFNLMDDDGWIAREQILGPEAASKVPAEFQTQYQLYANPPTMFMVIEMFLDRVLGEVPYDGHPSRYIRAVEHPRNSSIPVEARAFLETIYWKLKRHYLWWRRTQAGNIERYQSRHPPMDMDYREGYRWRGRTPQHVLTSGLDDYPRVATPSDDELHLDALCWVGLMSNTLRKISTALQLTSDPDFYAFNTHIAEIAATADGIHWSDHDQAYCDVTISPTGQVEHVCHKGYISLMPLLTGVLWNPMHTKLEAVLDLIEDPSHLWSPYGLRSLSTKDECYGTDENYWRSPIWVNINYLVLVRLLELAKQRGPQQERCSRIYTKLRKNIVNTVYQSWKDTGFAWEQYNPDSGKGQRTQHFTGWTALVVRIMAMPDMEGQYIKPYPTADNVIQNPAATSGHGLLVILTGVFILGMVFRRRIMQIWRKLMET